MRRRLLAGASLLLSSNVFAECPVITSYPQWAEKETLHADALYAATPKTSTDSDHRHVSFTDAYASFFKAVKDAIQSECDAKRAKGAVNLRITHSVDESRYYFSATFDFLTN